MPISFQFAFFVFILFLGLVHFWVRETQEKHVAQTQTRMQGLFEKSRVNTRTQGLYRELGGLDCLLREYFGVWAESR